MASIKTFIIAHTLLFSASILCMEQGKELTLKQKVASIKAKQKTYFEKCDTIGVHAGGEPALRGIAAACAYSAVRDIHAACTIPETAPYKIPAVLFNAFSCYVMHKTRATIATKKTNAEKDIATLLNDLDALLAEDTTIKPQQLIVGSLHTEIATQRTASKAYLTASIIGLFNLISTGYCAYKLHPRFEGNCLLREHISSEFMLNNFLSLAAVGYSYYTMTQERNALKTENAESAKLTSLLDNVAN